MATHVGVGLGVSEDSYIAGVNASTEAVSKIGGEPNLVIVFASTAYDQEKVNAGVRSVSGDALLVGSSTAGEITTNGPANRHSVAVMAIHSDDVQFYGGLGEGIAESPYDAGKKAADDVKRQASGALRTFMMLSDVLVG